MKSAWQIALLGFVVVFSSFTSAEVGEGARLYRSNTTTLIPLPAPDEESKGRPWAGEWWLGSSMQNFSEGKDEGTGSGVRIGTLLRYQLAPWARFHLEGEARLISSRVQTRYEEDVMASGLRMRDGYVAFGVPDTFEVRGGAIGQRDIKSNLLISRRRAFPGVRQDFHVKGSLAQLSVWAQQTVPTSYSLNTKRSEREETPSFLTETVNLKITPAKEFEAEFYATHYRFNNLPAVVAFESSALGNSVNGEVAANSEFKYDFDGFVLGTELCLCAVGPLNFRFGGQWLQNTAAPEEANRGQLLSLGVELKLRDLTIIPRYSVYFNESDTAPAYYNRFELGNNNRQGSIAELDIDFHRYGFTVEIEYVQAALINEDPFQFDKQVFTIGVETSHVPF